MTTLEEVAAELYRLPLTEFTGRRNTLAKELREDDRALADAVAQLPKPALSAWALDVFAHGSADELADLLELGAELREAQSALSGDRLKSLTAQAHTVVQRVVSDVARAAGRAGAALSDSMRGQVEQTLRAAMADEAAADAVRAGLLAKPLEAGGFGPVDLAGAVVGTPQPAPQRPRKRTTKQDDAGAEQAAERRRQAEQALADADEKLRRTRADLDREQAELEGAEQDRDTAAGRLTELRAELKRAEEHQSAAASRARAAARDKEKAEKRVHSAERAAEQARKALDDLLRRA